MRGKIWAIDFDGTLNTYNFPYAGEPIKENIAFVKKLREDGNKVILWTCRTGESLDYAVKWCTEQGLEFDAINENLPEVLELFGRIDSRKIKADYYMDDLAFNPFWKEAGLK